ncbi:Xylanase inhibitor, C-terminal, partial [Dillenia turbinata]
MGKRKGLGVINSSPLFHYNVDVESLAINGRVLSIDPEVFKSSRYRGAIFDSGSTFVSLIDEAYIPFAHSIKTALSHLVPVTGLEGDLCYESSTSKAEDFPIISFEFAGKAIMHLRAEDYLVEGMAGLIPIRCIGIRKTVIRGATIIG